MAHRGTTSESEPTELTFVEVKAGWRVPAANRRAADAALLLAVRLLGLDPAPAIRWFRQAGDIGERGDALLAETFRLLLPTDAALAAKAGGFVGDARTVGRAYHSEPRALWVATDLTPAQTAHTVLHEARHRWQAATGHWTGRGGAEEVTACEFDAEGFAIAHRDTALALLEAGAGGTR